MSGKLDLSLDEILNKELEQKTRRRSGRNHKAAPAGGIQKPARRASTNKPAHSRTTPANSESSIVVSNLVCLPSLPLPSEFTSLTLDIAFRRCGESDQGMSPVRLRAYGLHGGVSYRLYSSVIVIGPRMNKPFWLKSGPII